MILHIVYSGKQSEPLTYVSHRDYGNMYHGIGDTCPDPEGKVQGREQLSFNNPDVAMV